MTLTIDLPLEAEEALRERAQAEGLSVERYATKLLERDLEANGDRAAEVSQQETPISQVIAEIMSDVPAEEMAKLPKDGASQHDHYIYGWPKRRE